MAFCNKAKAISFPKTIILYGPISDTKSMKVRRSTNGSNRSFWQQE
jgi:hypothetical protein